ncbi:MAG: cation:proton antiporter [Oscillatoriales cyanobacterium]|nr:MAG: cation:proton antiporter [Oscillatoriales cyanobacterium]
MVSIVLFRLLLWLLLTADGSGINLAIGLLVAVLLPRQRLAPDRLRDWLQVLGKIAIAIPMAYIEAIEIMIWPHRHEATIREPVRPNRSAQLVFLDIFLITFTPKTIVSHYNEAGWYDVHQIERSSRQP